MSREQFDDIMGRIAETIGERPLDQDLAAHLTASFPPDGDDFKAVEALCREGEAEGWVCGREAGGIKFSRPRRSRGPILRGRGAHGALRGPPSRPSEG
ncbi:MAG: DUF4863 family protein [Limibacillus sp.]